MITPTFALCDPTTVLWSAGLLAALQLEADEAALAALQIGVGPASLFGVGVQSRKFDLRDPRVSVQIVRRGLRVAAVFAYAQR